MGPSRKLSCNTVLYYLLTLAECLEKVDRSPIVWACRRQSSMRKAHGSKLIPRESQAWINVARRP